VALSLCTSFKLGYEQCFYSEKWWDKRDEYTGTPTLLASL